MFGISGEHLVILLIIFLVVGPKKLPQLGNTLGKAIKNFKDAVAGVEDAKYRKIDDHSDAAEIVKNDPTRTAQPTVAKADTDKKDS